MTRLRSIELALPGAGAAAHFLTEHWGMAPATREADTWHLRGAGDDAYLLALTEADAPTVQSVTFIASEAEIDRIEASAGAEGAPVERVDATGETGSGRGILVTAPDGERFRFLSGVQSNERLEGCPDMPNRLTHVVFNARDAEASGDFVERVLGFRVSDRTKGMVFVRCDDSHHSIAFARAGVATLNHIAFEMVDIDAVMRGIGRMRDYGLTAAWGPGRHGPGNNVFAYYIAPFGPVIEYSTAVEKVGEDYRTGAPEDWTWPQNRIDQWGVTDKDVAALAVAERKFRFPGAPALPAA
ncbi:VOC family protein [Brevundimonas sp. AJA228-03]|uniref:VOC family protein n=1 Tax=Brevundimonas sp. AJA228-03 TaxID=2752515 RepID=UPI001ADF018B|nr:VOC family protein [Brevundimonas sp. AJA228-03]QTN19233.1 VOC family protein [Brevundimonas sp. AJA228-03]